MGIEDVGTTVQEALDEVGPNFTRATLESVVGRLEPDRQSHFSNFIFGSISWATDLGRPDTPTMAEGFEIGHEYWSFEPVGVGQGRVHFITGWRSLQDVNAIDGADSNEQHHVFFVADWHGITPNKISVAMRPVVWRERSPFAGVRVLRPPYVLVARASGLRFVEFEVVGIPHIDIERAGTLAP